MCLLTMAAAPRRCCMLRLTRQLTFHQLRQGRKLDFAAGFRMEYRLGQRVLVRDHPTRMAERATRV